MLDLELFIKWNTLHNKNSFHLFYIVFVQSICTVQQTQFYISIFNLLVMKCCDVLSFPWVWRSSSLWKMVFQIYQATAVILQYVKNIFDQQLVDFFHVSLRNERPVISFSSFKYVTIHASMKICDANSPLSHQSCAERVVLHQWRNREEGLVLVNFWPNCQLTLRAPLYNGADFWQTVCSKEDIRGKHGNLLKYANIFI